MQFIPSILLLILANIATSYLLPNPPGKYNVTLTTGTLTDYTRTDTSTTPPTPRELELSIFQPATCPSTVSVPYMPPQTAQFQGPFLSQIFNFSADLTPLFLDALLPVCPDDPTTNNTLSTPEDGDPKNNNTTLSNPPPSDPPILLFSPGYSIPRLSYSYLASALSSQGFTVITIDHPGDADIILYPDGHTSINNDTNQTIPDFQAHIPSRILDASFIIDQLYNASAIASLLPFRGPRAFSTDRVAMLGHSLGGVAAVLAAAQDPRIKGAINWDGTFVDLPPKEGVEQPTLLISHGDADESWVEAWPLLKGPKLWVNVENATHESFSDGPVLVQASGLEEPVELEGFLGTISAGEVVGILTAYSAEWMRGVFKGQEGGKLLEGEEGGRFPEVEVLEREGF